MPEGPEIRMNCLFINEVCSGKVFSGKPIRSTVAKSPDISFEFENYSISSMARGKELALVLQSEDHPSNRVRLLFRFGMSGKFMYTNEDDLPKHAHLQFYTMTADSARSSCKTRSVLSFVDTRRFGSWQMSDEWGKDRGPDVVYEYEMFRQNVLANLQEPLFNKSICEVLLNQKYFNGIGNYLRAEILYRARVPPFACARDVLNRDDSGSCSPDVLLLCRNVPLEVIQMKLDAEKTFDTFVKEDYELFTSWLQCYDQPGKKSVKDHNGRTMWYEGEAGQLLPKQKTQRQPRRKRHSQALESSLVEEKFSADVPVEVSTSILPSPQKRCRASIKLERKRVSPTEGVRRSARIKCMTRMCSKYGKQ